MTWWKTSSEERLRSAKLEPQSFFNVLGGFLEPSWEVFARPRCVQDGVKTAQDGAKTAQDGAKKAQDGAKTAQDVKK